MERPGRELPKEYREVVDYQIAVHGWRYETGRRHPVLYPDDPNQPAIRIPTTPSDRRSLRNFIAQVRRAGGTWPPVGKSRFYG
jgi:hypothetical protein